MTILPIVIAPDPRLKTPSAPVAEVTDDIRKLATDMLETMYAERGIGLAAVQVGEMKRMLVADVEWGDDGQGIVSPGQQWILINPEITHNSQELNVYKEGCLSFPDQYAEVERPLSIRVKFTDLSGAAREEEFTGILATCIQHEIDHINGIVFVDHLSRLKREMILKRLQKMKKLGYFDPHVHDERCGHAHHHVHDENCAH